MSVNDYNRYWFKYCDLREDGPGLSGKSHDEAIDIIRKEMQADGYSGQDIDQMLEKIAADYEAFIQH